jgi:hypothetical protein
MFRNLILLVIVCVHNGISFQFGATTGTCDTMVPVHPPNSPISPQQGDPPITFVVPDEITAGSQISVIIRTNTVQGFRGYKILARNQANNVIGRFLPSDGVGLLNCGQLQGSSATHTNPNVKTEVVLTWEAPQITEITSINFL